MTREKVSFDPNVPVTVTLRYPAGKIVSGAYGEQVMWGLEGNGIMFLDLAVAQKLNDLQPQQGESFTICKRWSGKKGDPIRWEVALSPATERMRAMREEPGESNTARQLRDTLRNVEEGRPAAAPRPQPVPAPVARRLDTHPGQALSAPAPGPTATSAGVSTSQHGNSTSALVDEANALVDAFAEVLARALDKHQGRIKPEEVRSMLLSAYIQRGKLAGGKHAAA